MNSLWSEYRLPCFNALENDIETDILIIGGGICGLLCAYMLDKAGADYVLLEGEKICSKTTSGTTAKITSQHGLIYSRLIKEFDADFARLYLEANEEALSSYARLCENIDCDFERTNAYTYSVSDGDSLNSELGALYRIGYGAELCKSLKLPFKVEGAIKFRNQAQFNPLKFIAHISRGLKAYENSRVLEMIGTTAVTRHGRVRAKRVIVATHFPFINKHGGYFLKMFQERSYVLALEGAQEVGGMYINASGKGLSFRNYDNLLLLGGGAHRTGKNGGGWRVLESFAKKHYPNAKIKYRWATQDCITLDGVPYIGQYSPSTPNLYVATGFNKWGMTSSMVSALILRDLMLGKKNKYERVFSPSRTILRPQLAVNAFEALGGWISFWGKKCPHLGCTLKWNKHEHTWDCPCHGSRFDKKGVLLDNPANASLKDI